MNKLCHVIFLLLLWNVPSSLAKPHINRLFSLGYTIVYVSNIINEDVLDPSLTSDLVITFNGLHGPDVDLVSSSAFWPAKNGKIVAANQSQAVVTEIKRHFGLKQESVCRIMQTVDLPGGGHVHLVQQIIGTRFSTTMSFGVSAVEFGIEEELFNDRQWHQIRVPHCDQSGAKIGEYTIHYCQYHFGSFFSGQLISRQTPFWEGITVMRRVVWNVALLCGGLKSDIKRMLRIRKGLKFLINQLTVAENFFINKFYDGYDTESNLLKHFLLDRFAALIKRTRVTLELAKKFNIVVGIAVTTVPLLLFSKPMLYPSVLYEVGYTKL